MTTDGATGVNVVNVRATAVVPTTFMKLANFTELTVNAQGEATRRMVDLSLVLDVSSSIGSPVGRGPRCVPRVRRWLRGGARPGLAGPLLERRPGRRRRCRPAAGSTRRG